jgi:DNA-binding NarL/FixJ family response regulator
MLIPFCFASFGQSDDSSVFRDIPLRNHFKPSEYSGGIQSWSFDQDSSGILYVANNYGLLEFNGSKWILHDVPNCTRVRVVKVDSKNRIFVGGQGQIGYFTRDKRGFVFTSLLEKLPLEFQKIAETWEILEHQNKIYIKTESQLFVLDQEQMKILSLPGFIRQIEKVGNNLFVQVNIGLFKLIDGKFDQIEGISEFHDIISIYALSNSYYYFLSSGEIYKHDESGLTIIDLPFYIGAINDVVKLSSGAYCIGTQNNGLYILNSDLSLNMHLTKNEGLSDRTVKSIYEDNFQNLWVALNNGIDYLKTSLPFSLINEEAGLEGTGYAACKFAKNIYLGTNNGAFVLKNRNASQTYGNYEIIEGSEGQAYNFSSVEGDLILNHDKGAFQINELELVQVHDLGSWKFIETPIPGLILGGDYQGMAFFKKSKGKWKLHRRVDGFTESSRRFLFENDTLLWMTHGSKGAYRLTFDEDMNIKSNIVNYGVEDGFPSNLKISVYPLADKLVFTAESGIYNFNHDSNLFISNSFFSKWLDANHVNEIASDGSNTIYYIQDMLFGRIVQESFGAYRKETGHFKHINPLINDDLPNISILDKRNVLIGAKEGFIRYQPNKLLSRHENIKVLLRSAKIKISPDSLLMIYPAFIESIKIQKKQSIKFEYAAPYFDGIEDIKYSFRLLPLENKWSDWSPLSEKEYPYLPSGLHIFEVKAQNIYGEESEVARFNFEVLKPWFLSNWAIILYAFSGLVLILVVLLIQQKKFNTEKSIITKDKEEALKSKNEEIDQISSDSKKEIDKLQSEKLQTEIDLKNDRLTTTTMLLMNKNEFIQNIRERIETYIKKDVPKQELNQLVRTIDDNLSNNDSWDQFAYHFDQVHGDYLKKLSESNIQLSPREIKLAAFLRMNMSSKEISSLLNITPRSVELARYRLRKKLMLERDQNLVEYLINLDSN